MNYEENVLPIKYVTDITRKYGSYEEFTEQYKKGRIDYDFGKDVFCGYRGVTISEQEMTEEQKQRYITLLKDLLEPGETFDLSFENGDYIDIDKLMNCIGAMPKKYQNVIKWYYGLNGEKLTYSQIGKRLGIHRNTVLPLILTALQYIKNHKQTNEPMKNIKIMLQQYESRCKNIQDCINDLEVVKLYIADENRKIRGEVESTRLEQLRTCGEEHHKKNENALRELTGIKQGFPVTYIEELLIGVEQKLFDDTYIEDMGFSVRTYNCLKRAQISTIAELVSHTKKELSKNRSLGAKSLEEIEQKLAKIGLQLRQENIDMPLVANIKTRKSYMKTLSQRCNMLLEICKSKMERLDEYGRKEVDTEIAGYNEARDNYLNRENIFDPKGIVPAVTRNRENENDEISQPEDLGTSPSIQPSTDSYIPKSNLEGMTLEELEQENQNIQSQIQQAEALVEQKKKEELIKSIANGQQELERLKAILASLGMGLDE